MTNDLVQYSIPDIEKMATAIAKSKLFGVSTPEQAIALMLVAQAEGRHPALAARDYHIIQNRPAKTADAMLRDFLASGGKVEWEALTDERAVATFSHPSGGSVKIDWDMARAKKAGLGTKDMWLKYPRQMLRARCVSEGIRTVCPGATSGFYAPEEVKDFEDDGKKNVTKEAIKEIFDSTQKPEDAVVAEDELEAKEDVPEFLRANMLEAASKGVAELTTRWKALDQKYQSLSELKRECWEAAKKADEENK